MVEPADELMRRLRVHLERQDGVVARRQALGAGLHPHDLARLLRRRHLAPLCRGALVGHTGHPTWRQRAWGAVLALWPAAVVGESALALARGSEPSPFAAVHVAVAGDRSAPAPLPGVHVRHLQRLDEVVQWHLGPPRQRLEEAVVDVAAAARDDLEAVAVLADAVGSRLTTAARLTATLAQRPRVARRAWLGAVLDDVAGGTCSVLEHGLLTRVERPHGLPPAHRQRAEHGSRDADMDRDLDVAAAGGATVRLGYGQVHGRPCATAAALARFLLVHGLQVSPHGCGPACPVQDVADGLARGSLAPGAWDPRTGVRAADGGG